MLLLLFKVFVFSSGSLRVTEKLLPLLGILKSEQFSRILSMTFRNMNPADPVNL